MRFPHITEFKEYREDWEEDYKRKLVSAEDAARVVKSGTGLFYLLRIPHRCLWLWESARTN